MAEKRDGVASDANSPARITPAQEAEVRARVAAHYEATAEPLGALRGGLARAQGLDASEARAATDAFLEKRARAQAIATQAAVDGAAVWVGLNNDLQSAMSDYQKALAGDESAFERLAEQATSLGGSKEEVDEMIAGVRAAALRNATRPG